MVKKRARKIILVDQALSNNPSSLSRWLKKTLAVKLTGRYILFNHFKLHFYYIKKLLKFPA